MEFKMLGSFLLFSAFIFSGAAHADPKCGKGLTLEQANELEKKGIFCDDDLPIELVNHPEVTSKPPSPPGSCNTPELKMAWLQGRREGVSGQRYDLEETGTINGSSLPTSLDRSSCQVYRKLPNIERNLECCRKGFFSGMQFLTVFLNRNEEKSLTLEEEKKYFDDQFGTRAFECRDAYERGGNRSNEVCSEIEKKGCVETDLTKEIFLGCYILGFARHFVKCPCQPAKEFAAKLRKLVPAIFADGPTISKVTEKIMQEDSLTKDEENSTTTRTPKTPSGREYKVRQEK